MFRLIVIMVCALTASTLGVRGAQRAGLAFRDASLTVDERVDDLVGRMTLEEKIGQMLNNAPAIERLGIPAYNWWNEALHGVARSPYPATSFPQAIGMAATWDVDAVYRMADYVSTEGRAIFHDSERKGRTGIYTGLTYWSPNINIFRDPRWGRGQETYGEDPFLTSSVGASFVRGLQGDDPVYLKSSACAKHFAVHSGPEWNRHTFNSAVSDFDLWDTYLPAFRELVVEAKVSGVMCAYNAFQGQPCCGNDALMTSILKDRWHFDGYVTSDCGAIEDFYRTHKTHPDAPTAAADAVLHGTDCDCGSEAYMALADAVGMGLLKEEDIDASLRRLFKIRFRLGMFDPRESVPYADTPLSVLESEPHKAHALKMARESIVLLRNEGGLLPLDKKKVKKIAVVGPNADSESVLLANYYGNPTKVTTLLEGIREKAGRGIEVIFRKGVNLVDDHVFTSGYKDELFTYGGKRGFHAEYFQNTRQEGKPGLMRVERAISHKWGEGEEIGGGIVARNMSAHWSTVFTAPSSGEVCFELRADEWAELSIDGVKQEKTGLINAYYPMKAEKGRSYKLDISYRQTGENGDIFLDFGTLEKADHKATAAAVRDADIIIFAGGISAKVEGEEMGVVIDGFRRGDRTSIDLPAVQTALLRELAATGKPVVFVLMTGSAIGLEWESENIPAILNAWYGGQAGGEAVADVLFGDYNPAGRLPVTFYRSAGDLPDYEDYSMAGRTYRYFTGPVVYPFGYGLSYTTFAYRDIKVDRHGASLKVTATVSNTGERAGDEVVQLYLSNRRDFTTPIRSLKGFRRIHLKPGQSQTVVFDLTPGELTVVDPSGNPEPIKGSTTISIGGSQPTAPLLSTNQQTITL
ncbi:MAG: glycoside hydrolase family 3 C-terminal domain-containing protein [Tannerellaceae bacterium]|jgi:beta-glucosidase|nr:glycoside hydrolase family 3 C-terminal domain-containing protein [Tannerellaceae bacterium]